MTDVPRDAQPVEPDETTTRLDEHDAAVAEAEARPDLHAVPDEPRLPSTRPLAPLHPDPDTQILNRELSWLSFNERVLALAGDEDRPLLERAKFLAIFASNLDEFFQVRVAGLLEQRAAGLTARTPDGMTPSEQLTALRGVVDDLYVEAAQIFHTEVAPGLAEAGVKLSDWGDLDDDDREWLVEEFDEKVFPVLTPLAVDPAHPFPYISNLSLNLAVKVRDPQDGEVRFARVKIPPILPRFVLMPDGERFLPLEQLIAAHLDRLFRGMEVVEHHVFRVTRNADLVVEEEEAGDLLLAIESELTRRRFGRVVRLEVEPSIADDVLDLLVRELEIGDEQVHIVASPLDLSGLMSLLELDRPELKDPSFSPTTQPRLAAHSSNSNDFFRMLKDDDVLVQHPYDSFASSVQTFIEHAARDPHVMAIKMTLYRTSGPGSPIVRALLEAAEEGKQVVALVELKARFDEEANIEWARTLEEAGVHVAYGVVGLKTHTKVALVVRNEGGRVTRYAHLGTGNYNDKTARIYEDIGLLTANQELGADLTDLFNVLTGYSQQSDFRKLLVAPTGLRRQLVELIRREAAADDGHIVMKANALVDEEITDELYAAAATGTPIDLVIRGICCIRPGVPGLSESIRVRSIVGRYLEHSRIYRFGSEARGFDYLIGSADLMTRNLSRRVEAVAPIESETLKARLEEVLQTMLADTALAWDLHADGSWHRVAEGGLESHLHLEALAHERAAQR